MARRDGLPRSMLCMDRARQGKAVKYVNYVRFLRITVRESLIYALRWGIKRIKKCVEPRYGAVLRGVCNMDNTIKNGRLRRPFLYDQPGRQARP